MTDTIDSITILKCREPNKMATKKFSRAKDGTIEKLSFSAGRFFTYEEHPVSNLKELSSSLTSLMNERDKLVVRGKPKAGAPQTVFRRIHGPEAAFEQIDRRYLMLDVDKQKLPEHFDLEKNPEEAVRWIREALPPPFNSTTCFYKFSSSQNVPQKIGDAPPATISVHLWFWCDRPVSEQEWKRFFRANPCPVDQSIFSPVQIHYTATPIFEGIDDPLPKRSGIVKGDYEVLAVPAIPEPEKQKSSKRPAKAPEIKQENKDRAMELLAAYYEEGNRDRLAGAISGTLYRGGWQAEDVADFVCELAESENDPDASNRFKSALRICEAIDSDRPAQGLTTLREEFEIERLDEILELLGVGKPDVPAAISRLSQTSSATDIEDVMKFLMDFSVADQAIYLDQIIDQVNRPKSTINKIFNAIKNEVESSSADRIIGVVEDFLDKHYEKGRYLLRAKDGNFWQYNGRYWEVAREDLLKKKLLPYASQVADDKRQTSALINAGINILKGRMFREGDPLRLTSDPPAVINCRNGELWFDEVGNISFKPHRAESYLRHCLDVNYDEKAKSPEFDKAVLEIFKESSDSQAMFDHFMELIGYICQTWRKIAIIVLLYGGGSNGKTSLMSILERLLGENSIMSDRITEIENHAFKVGALSGKLLLIDDDVDAGTCLPDGFLKKISEEKTMTGQLKYRDAFDFKCRVVPVLLANGYPSLKDLTNGIRRRIMVVPFQRTFEKHEIVPGLFDDIWKTEASGILNHAISGFQRLKKRTRFDEPKDCVLAKQEWLVRSNVLVTYVEEICKKGEKLHQGITEFYERFSLYCSEAGVTHKPDMRGIRNRLESMGYDLTPLNGYTVIRGLRAPDWGEIDQEALSRGTDLLADHDKKETS